MSTLTLAYDLQFSDLYRRDGLIALDTHFLNYLQTEAPALHPQLLTARAAPESFAAKQESELLTALAPTLERFLAHLFGIEPELDRLIADHHTLTPIYLCKRLFVQRRAAKAVKAEEVLTLDGLRLESELAAFFGEDFSEENYARNVMAWLQDEANHTEGLSLAARYAAWAVLSDAGREHCKHTVLFQTPKKLNFDCLVPVETIQRHGVTMLKLPDHDLRPRHGFALTDQGANLKQALDEANYCIFCHHQGKDSCSKGLKEKDGSFKQNHAGVTLTGCPLEEKISEMHSLKAEGFPIGALAVAVVDNPMIAGTGHRICNDCMKSCIYQKQQPVNIPQAETRTLKDVLNLPWGFEIYSLLTRWNPLNLRRPLPKPDTGRKALIVGMGPAGYTLAHHLMNDGHTIVAIDGLKIEPVPEALLTTPIRDITTLQQPLNTRIGGGFGGVAEYGITVRWDKNFLTLIRLLLERRDAFALFGGIRFGGTVTVDDAWKMGFDHIALCMGAGKPTVLNIPNGMARGVRTASDFLMALQLTGAAREDSLANLQLRLPVVVIGGGLTGIDTTTEALAYYPVQVEKFLRRYEQLVTTKGEAAVRTGWSEEETILAEEWINHAHALRTERQKPTPDITNLLLSWGGATLAYRNALTNAPSYRLNHEEVELALQEGIRVAENLTPTRIETDKFGAAETILMRDKQGAEHRLPARTILVAAGTQPNTVLAREDASRFSLDGNYFQAITPDGHPITPQKLAKPDQPHLLLHRAPDGRSISFFGDLHPSYAGNVVKAMGSAKQGYPFITAQLLRQAATTNVSRETFLDNLKEQFTATVTAVHRLTPTIIEIVIHAPMAATRFQPGQFYRLQNFENLNPALGMEGLALTGASSDPEQGLLSLIVLEMGGSSDLCTRLQPGERVILMGPTGTPTEIPHNKTILLAGGGLGNAVLFSIGKAMRANGCKVLYFAGYKQNRDRYKLDEIEAAADTIVWCCDETPDFTARRPQDSVFHGNIVQAMLHYATTAPDIRLQDVDHLIAIGSDRMMAAVTQARHTVLKDVLNPAHHAIGSINSPMQCMMKEICAQCLQKHIDPKTGEEHYVFSCFNQDQVLDDVCFDHLRDRLKQNSLQEKLTAQWIEQLVA